MSDGAIKSKLTQTCKPERKLRQNRDDEGGSFEPQFDQVRIVIISQTLYQMKAETLLKILVPRTGRKSRFFGVLRAYENT